MLDNTDESNEVINGKDVTIDLAGCTISSNETVLVNKGTLTIIDSGKNGETYGKVLATGTESAINNISGAELTLGENDGTVTRNITIEATNAEKAIINMNEGIFNFYDGQVIGKPAIDGEITKYPQFYKPVSKSYDEKREVVYLDIVTEAVARIGYNYFTTIQAAVDAVPNGHYGVIEKDAKLIDQVEFAKGAQYGFEKNEEGQLVSNNKNKGNTVANSYIKIDLRDKGDMNLKLDASVSSEQNRDYAYATITDGIEAPKYDSSTNRFIYESGIKNKVSGEYALQGGSIYYLHLGYRKDNYTDGGNDQFIINSITLNGKDVFDKTGPVYEEQTEIVMVNNATVTRQVNINETKNIILDLDGYTISGSGSQYIINNNGKLEITDKSEAKTGTISHLTYRAISNNKELTISEGKITIGIGTSSNYNIGIYNNINAILKINGGKLESSSNYVRLIYNDDSGKVYINDGILKATSTGSGQAIFNNSNPTGIIEVSGGKITAGKFSIYNNSLGMIDVKGGTIKSTNIITSNYEGTIYNGSKGAVNIEGGTILSNTTAISNRSSGVINIKGGDIEGGNSVILSYGPINMTGGDISGTNDVFKVNNKTSITGGTISGNYNLITTDSGSESYIENIDLNPATGGAIYLQGTSGKGKLVVNNCNINATTRGKCIGVQYRGNIEIKGNSNLTSTNDYAIDNGDSQSVTIIGEKNEDETQDINMVPVIKGKSYGINNSKGKLYFYDGKIIGNTDGVNGRITEIEENTELLIQTVDGNKEWSLTKDRQPVAQIGENTYYTLEDAIKDIQTSDETKITILRDILIMTPQQSSEIIEDKNIIIDLNGNNITTTLEDTIVNRGNLTITDNKQSGKIRFDVVSDSSTYIKGIKNQSTGTLKIENNIEIETTGTNVNIIENEGNLELTNVKLKMPRYYTSNVRIIYNTGNISITNNTIESEQYASGVGIYNQTGTININGITTQGYIPTIETYEGEINITGENTINSAGAFINSNAISRESEGTTINITEATITGTGGAVISSVIGNVKITQSTIDKSNTNVNIISSGRASNGAKAMNTIIENSTLITSGRSTISYGHGDLEIKNSTIENQKTSSGGSRSGCIYFGSQGTLKILCSQQYCRRAE